MMTSYLASARIPGPILVEEGTYKDVLCPNTYKATTTKDLLLYHFLTEDEKGRIIVL